ncbi:hypothetical protein SELMODRAFT_170710 [Selaginella moellendorffii]|uniref:pyridoxal kinase n=1 Tax=Selaginella moellendorffii TaxID=88036 RepID=D8RED0_SELML|nr:hypothetical protein SELMODRAFT_170710 [Selaginella moellendorffii]
MAPLSGHGARVLSIQSHTVHGYVGNKSAVFPLQLLGFDVDPINSRALSRGAGYPVWRGQVLDGDQLWALIEGLEANNLLFYTHLLTGYIGSASFLRTVHRVIEKLRSVNPNLVYVCDPVMGDEGRLYVAPELVPLFRDLIVPVATMLTPNQFEAERLTGRSIRTTHDARQACRDLHGAGPSKVVITSMDADEKLLLVGSHKKGESFRQFQISIPKLPMYFTGTGDLMTSLLLGWSHRYPDSLETAAELAVSSLQAVLHKTLSVYKEEGVQVKAKQPELQLVQSQEEIKSPTTRFVAEILS